MVLLLVLLYVNNWSCDNYATPGAHHPPLSPALAMAAPYSSLAGWTPRPAPFDASKHGTRVEFSEQCSVAERVRPEEGHKNAVVYTAQPVPVGEVWRITVLSTIRGWAGGLVSGWVLCSLYCQRVVV